MKRERERESKAAIFDWFESMEGEGSSEGESDRKRGGGSDDNINHGESNNKIVVYNEGQSKPKRQMKTPFQLETLEKAYACKFLFVLQFHKLGFGFLCFNSRF